MEEVKGSLRNSTVPILKFKIRNNNGEPEHKGEFRLNDKASGLKFLHLLKDKYGIDYLDIRDPTLQTQEMNDEMKHLEDWRERTKALREDGDFTEKMRKAFSL